MVRLLASLLLVISISPALAAREQESGAVDLVTRMYMEYAWEAVISEPRNPAKGLMEESKDHLSKYFDAHLVELILEDRACVARTEDLCNLDWVPIWGGQDPGASELKIKQGADQNTVRVQFRYPSSHELIELTYVMRKTSSGWRIRDIVSRGGSSLVKALEN